MHKSADLPGEDLLSDCGSGPRSAVASAGVPTDCNSPPSAAKLCARPRDCPRRWRWGEIDQARMSGSAAGLPSAVYAERCCGEAPPRWLAA